MKKLMILVCTMVCAGQLYSMEPIEPYYRLTTIRKLPEAIQLIINSSNNLDEIVKKLELDSINDEESKRIVWEDEYEFTKLAHALANKFNLSTEAIANKFTTKAANEYKNMGDELINIILKHKVLTNVIFRKDLNAINQLIARGVDVNYSNLDKVTPLIAIMKAAQGRFDFIEGNYQKEKNEPFADRNRDRLLGGEINIASEFMTLLLDAGANPNLQDQNGRTALDYAPVEGPVEGGIRRIFEEKIMQK